MLAQVKAEPPLSQPDGVSGLPRGLLFLSQVVTGALTGAFPDQAHDGLQQSQYRVVWPVDCANTVEMKGTVRSPNAADLYILLTAKLEQTGSNRSRGVVVDRYTLQVSV